MTIAMIKVTVADHILSLTTRTNVLTYGRISGDIVDCLDSFSRPTQCITNRG